MIVRLIHLSNKEEFIELLKKLEGTQHPSTDIFVEVRAGSSGLNILHISALGYFDAFPTFFELKLPTEQREEVEAFFKSKERKVYQGFVNFLVD